MALPSIQNVTALDSFRGDFFESLREGFSPFRFVKGFTRDITKNT